MLHPLLQKACIPEVDRINKNSSNISTWKARVKLQLERMPLVMQTYTYHCVQHRFCSTVVSKLYPALGLAFLFTHRPVALTGSYTCPLMCSITRYWTDACTCTCNTPACRISQNTNPLNPADYDMDQEINLHVHVSRQPLHKDRQGRFLLD